MPDFQMLMRAMEQAMGLPESVLSTPPEKVTATEVLIGRPRGSLFYLSEPSIAGPGMGVDPASHFDTSPRPHPNDRATYGVTTIGPPT